MNKADNLLKAAAEQALTIEYCSYLPKKEYSHIFSEKFCHKMRRLIRMERKPYYKVINTASRRVACAIVTLLVTAGVTVMSVEALRTEFINFIVETFEKFSAIYSDNYENSPKEFEKIYEIGYHTDEFKLDYFASTEIYRHSIYVDGSDVIYFYQNIKDSFDIGVNTKGYEIIEAAVGEYPALYYEKNGYSHVIWDDGSYVFCIYTNLGKDKAFEIAETIREKE